VALPLGWAAVRLFGLERGSPWVQLVAFTPCAGLAGLILVAVLLAARRWLPGAVAGLAVLVLVGCVAPRAIGAPSTQDGPTLVVMSVNLRFGGADVVRVAELAREHRVDVLALQEFTPAAEQRFQTIGIDASHPHSERRAVDRASGSALYSRWPLIDARSVRNGGGFWQSGGIVQVPGAAPVWVHSVHPLAPATGDAVPLWISDMRAQPRADAGALPRILAGDFNATLDHAAMREVLSTGYRDAADEVGAGLTPTWPYAGRRSLVTPKVAIDHILVTGGIAVRDFRAAAVRDTDHRAILAVLVLPPATGSGR
jgi:endonuclease/exonuclease/phosphatase (EEP) superfamily protein YafD